jgi:hypothetical protein
MQNDATEMAYLLSRLSPEAIRERIEFIRRADLKTVQIDDLKTALHEMLRAYGCYVKSIEQGTPLFRAVKHNADEDEFKSVNRMYPDPIFLKKLGRANREHRAIFYLSGDCVIAFHEVGAKAGDVISLLECRPRDDASPVLVPIGIDEMLKQHGVKSGGDFPETAVRVQELLKHDTDNLLKYRMIDEFLTAEFLKKVGEGQEHEYKTTVAIAELLFSFDTGHQPVDGLAYPSIAGQRGHANVALTPEAFHRLYRPITCQRIKVTGLLAGSGISLDPKVGVTANRIHDDGQLEWPALS